MTENLENTKDNSNDFIGDVRASSYRWTQEEVDCLMQYTWASDYETIDECLEHARYMLYFECGMGFPERSLSAVKNKFYKEVKKAQNS